MDDDQTIPEGYTPFSTSTTDPSGATTTLTGYGPRARIVPPSTPDIGAGVAAAFQNLPVDQAAKAVEAAMRYQAQRGYQQDLAAGKNAAEAFAKWGPMLFHQATGIPEAINRSVPPPITPQQMIQNRLAQAKFDAAQAAAKAKAEQGAIRSAGGGLYRISSSGPAEELVPPKASTSKDPALGDAYKQLDEARKDMAKLVANPPPKSKAKEHQKAMDDATMRMRDARITISKLTTPQTPAQEPPNPAQTKKANEVIRMTGDGKKAVFDADTKKFIRYAQ